MSVPSATAMWLISAGLVSIIWTVFGAMLIRGGRYEIGVALIAIAVSGFIVNAAAAITGMP